MLRCIQLKLLSNVRLCYCLFIANWRSAPGGLLQEGHYDYRTQRGWSGCNSQDPPHMWVLSESYPPYDTMQMLHAVTDVLALSLWRPSIMIMWSTLLTENWNGSLPLLWYMLVLVTLLFEQLVERAGYCTDNWLLLKDTCESDSLDRIINSFWSVHVSRALLRNLCHVICSVGNLLPWQWRLLLLLATKLWRLFALRTPVKVI